MNDEIGMMLLLATYIEDQDVANRLDFYFKMYIDDPKSKACPYANLRGILVNVVGLSQEHVDDRFNNRIDG